MQTGEKLLFGKFEWRVLAVQDDRALIITESIIEQRPYHDAYVTTTWVDCALRRYLNGDFYQGFSPEEQRSVIPVLNQNHDNQWYGTAGGADTQDYVFVLSLEEVCRYFGDSLEKLYNKGKNQRYWFERKDENNSKRIAHLQENGWGWWWWLRSPGRVGVKAAYIFGTDGNIGIQGNNILKGNLSDGKCTGGIRPALWLTIR